MFAGATQLKEGGHKPRDTSSLRRLSKQRRLPSSWSEELSDRRLKQFSKPLEHSRVNILTLQLMADESVRGKHERRSKVKATWRRWRSNKTGNKSSGLRVTCV